MSKLVQSKVFFMEGLSKEWFAFLIFQFDWVGGLNCSYWSDFKTMVVIGRNTFVWMSIVLAHCDPIRIPCDHLQYMNTVFVALVSESNDCC